MSTRIALCDEALQRIGAQPLQSETAAGAAPVIAVYDDVLGVLAQMSAWSFLMRTRELARYASAPASGFWTYGFQLPADRLGPPVAVFDSKDGVPFTGYELEGGDLLSDAEQIFVRYRRLPQPVDMSPMFRSALVKGVMAELALSRREDAGLATTLKREVWGDDRVPGDTGLVHKAIALDQASQPSPVLMPGGGPLLESRLGSGYASAGDGVWSRT